MAVLLAGGAGYIGSHTAVELLNSNYRVIIADNFSNSSENVIAKIEKISSKSVKLYHTDFTDIAQIRELFKAENIDSVIHFAGFKAVGESVQNPLLYYNNNIVSTLNLLKVMNEYGVKKLVFSSSATVYSPENKIPYTEEMPLAPVSPYGRSKMMSEEIISDFCKVSDGFSAVILRYFNPIGAHESGLIGENPSGIPNNLMPYITRVSVGMLSELSVFGDDYPTEDGTGVRDYIHVCDLAQGHISALTYLLDHSGVEVVNLGNGRGYSVLEVIKTFSEQSGVPIPYKIAPRRGGDIAEYYADTKKATKLFNYTAKRTIADMCRDSYNFQKMNTD